MKKYALVVHFFILAIIGFYSVPRAEALTIREVFTETISSIPESFKHITSAYAGVGGSIVGGVRDAFDYVFCGVFTLTCPDEEKTVIVNVPPATVPEPVYLPSPTPIIQETTTEITPKYLTTANSYPTYNAYPTTYVYGSTGVSPEVEAFVRSLVRKQADATVRSSRGGSGTVESVDMSVPTGLSISGGPITKSGTLALSLTSGYEIPITASTTNWDDFYVTPSNRITAGTGISWSGNTLNVGTSTLGLTTTDIAEGSNLYFTNARTDARISTASSTIRGMISSSATGLTYTSGTGVFSFTDDLYNIPLTASTTEWTNGYADRVTLGNPNTWTAQQTFNESVIAYKGNGSSAGYFADGTNSVTLADGMYAINASGSMKLSGEIYDLSDEASLEPNNRKLKDQYGLTTIDWSGAQNSSAGLSFDSLQGGYFSKGLNVTDGTRTVALADGTIAVSATGGYSNFSNNGALAQFGYSGVAGYFTNGGRYLVLADGTYAIDATGNSRFTGNVELSNATASTLASFDGSKNLVSLDTGTYPSLTELAYVKGVTSAIQTQLDGTALLAGRSTPQQFNFGTASGASTGYLTSTSHATKGKYFLNSAGTITVDELNTRFGIGTSSPSQTLDVNGNIQIPTSTSTAGTIYGAIYQNGSRFIHSYGTNNMFVGPSSGNFTLTVGTANQNVGIGAGTLSTLTAGQYNMAMGQNSLVSLTSGSSNVGIGNSTLYTITTQSGNVAIGDASFFGTLTSGSVGIGHGTGRGLTGTTANALFLGNHAGSAADGGIQIGGLSNVTAIGTYATVNRSNTMVLGGTGQYAVDAVFGTSTAFAKLSIQNSYGSTTPLFDIATTTSSAFATSSLFRVNADGNVGIGTTSPVSKLSIVGTSGQNPFVIASSTGVAMVQVDTNGGLELSKNGDVSYMGGIPGTSGYSGIWFRLKANATAANYAFLGSATETFFNAPSGGTTYFRNGNTNQMIINSSGNVGIGTTTPSARLTVSGSGTGSIFMDQLSGATNYGAISFIGSPTASNYNLMSASNDQNLYFNRPTGQSIQFREANGTPSQVIIATGGNVGIGTTTPDSTFGKVLHVAQTAAGNSAGVTISNPAQMYSFGLQGSTGNFGIYHHGTSNYPIMITTTDNVGIGTTTPNTKLTIGSGQITVPNGTTALPSYAFSNRTNGGMFTDGTIVYLTNGSGNQIQLGSGGGLTFGSRVDAVNGTAGQPTYSFTNASDAGMFRSESGSQLGFSTAGTERLHIDASGNVGIGTTTPSTRLSVVTGSSGAGLLVTAGAATGSYNNHLALFQSSTGVAGVKIGKVDGGGQTLYPAVLGVGSGSLSGYSGETFAGLDISVGSLPATLLLGADINNVTRTNNTSKVATIGVAPYGTSNYPMGVLYSSSNATTNILNWGGAGGTLQLPTEQNFYTATATNTLSSSGLLRMTINSSGNVGIGTTTPSSKLAVLSTTEQLRLNYDPSNYSKFTVGSASDLTLTPGVNGTSAFNFTKADGSTSILNVDSTNTRVGIGTASPAFDLHVNNSSSNARIKIQAELAAVLQIDRHYSSESAILSFSTNGGANYSFGLGDGSSNFVIGDSGFVNKYLTINTTGNIGIGTTTPGYKLSVAGTVGFSSLTANTGAGSLCLTAGNEVVYNGASDSCLPSLRNTKHDINALSVNALDIIKQLEPVSFVYNEGNGKTRFGFIAEDTANVNENLATYNSQGEITGIDDRSMISVLIRAVKDMLNSFEKVFAWFSGDGSKLKVQGDICVDDVCVTKEQFKSMLINAGGAAASQESNNNTSDSNSNSDSNNNSSDSQSSETATSTDSTDNSNDTPAEEVTPPAEEVTPPADDAEVIPEPDSTSSPQTAPEDESTDSPTE